MRENAKSRTDQKLRYAEIHFRELCTYDGLGSNDEWENAHHESCFYHLAGCVEAILHEVNVGYSLGLDLDKVTCWRVRDKLGESCQSSAAFDRLKELCQDSNSWLSLLFEWRNHGTHRARIGKVVYLSTKSALDNDFNDPRTGEPQNVYPGLKCTDVHERLIEDVRELVDYCRRDDPKL